MAKSGAGGRAWWWTLAALLVVALVGGVVWWSAASRRPRLPGGALRGANVLLVTIDTLRADRVGAYGGGTLTPSIDALAARGVRFARAYAHVPMTLPSHATILTGLTPPGHGVRNNGTFRLSDKVETMASVLAANGYDTGAFVGSFVLDARFGLARGFKTYDDRLGDTQGPVSFGFVERRADRVLAAARGWLADRDRQSTPWFAWIHLFDPHAPYDAPEHRVDSPYDNEVAFVDAKLGNFVEDLGRSGLLASTLVVLTSDHGESLGEHGEATHGLFAYDATLRVPLIVSGPHVPAAVVDARVSHVDLLPTVLDLLGVPAPAACQGRSLRPLVSGESREEAPIYFEALDASLTRGWAPLTGLIQRGEKYVDLPIEELYDLDQDPHEERNLASGGSERAQRAAGQLAELRRSLAREANAPTIDADAEAEARLRALGYAGGAGPAGRHTVTEADDPKRLVALNALFTDALSLGPARRSDAVDMLRRVIGERPDFVAAYTSMSSLLIAMGRPFDAVNLLSSAPEAVRATTDVTRHLGNAFLAAGRPEDVVRTLEPLVREQRGGADAENALGVAYSELGRLDDAQRVFERVLAASPNAAGTWNNLGIVEMRRGATGPAAVAFERAVTADPAYAPAWQGLGHARLAADPAGAIDAWTRAVTLVPDDYDTLFNLGLTLARSGRGAEALPYLEQFAQRAPGERYARDREMVRALIKDISRGPGVSPR